MIRWTVPLALAGTRWALSKFRRERKSPQQRCLEYAKWAAAGAAIGVGASVLSQRGPASRMTGKVVLVTGGSRGLGLQLAREFGASGASVVVCGRDRENLDLAVSELQGSGVRAYGIACDVSDPDQVRGMVDEAAEHFGRLDIVVNNAGIMWVGPQEVATDENVRRAMDTMFWAPYHVSRSAFEHLRASKGSIVNITSIGAYLSVPHLLPYSYAKHAWAALSEGMAAEAAGTGVKVTTVVPGLMRTGSHRGVVFAGVPEREYAWFALSAGMPLLSVNGERAARSIVRAAANRRGFLVLTPAARVGMALHGIAPGLVQAVMGVANRLLPDAPHHVEERLGSEAAQSRVGKFVNTAAVLNERASRRLNQE